MALIIFSIITSFVIYLIAKLFGECIKNKSDLFELYPAALIGISFYFSIIMITCVPLTIFKVANSLNTILYMLPLLVMALYVVINFKRIDLKKLLILVPVVLIVSILLYRSSFYSIGSTSDSIFYVSMVNENAFSPFWTPLEYYTGSPIDYSAYVYQPQYDFQAFYHLFAYITKIAAQFINEISYAPIYIWGALSMFLFLMVDTILELFSYLFKKNKLVSLLFVFISLVFSVSSWSLLYAYIGNSWRILFTTLSLMSVYKFLKNNESKDLFVLGMSTGGLVATTSSGIFINSFIIVSLMIYIVIKKLNPKYLIITYLMYSITALYAFSYIFSFNRKLSIVFAVSCFVLLFVLFIYSKLNDKVRSIVGKVCIVFVLLVILGLSFFVVKNYSIVDFFKRNINEMSINYFVFDDIYTICTNGVWILSFVAVLINFKNKLLKNTYFNYLLIVLAFFLNPIVAKVWMHFIAGIVYYRSYEILFNYFNFIFLAYGGYLLSKKIKLVAPLIVVLLSVGIYGNFNDNPYTFDLDESINPIYRIPELELEADLELAKLVADDGYRVRTISQTPFTKGIVNNINLSFGVSTTRSFCTTCNELYGPVEELSPIFNLFFLRDYADQMIFSTSPNYDGACDLLFERNFKYLLLDKEQTRKENGVYVPVFHCLRACNDVVFENDRYVVMENRYVQ